MPTRKYADEFLFTLENVVIVPRKTIFFLFKKKWFWLIFLPSRNYPNKKSEDSIEADGLRDTPLDLISSLPTKKCPTVQ